MADGSLGSLFVELTANTAQLVKGMNEAKDAVKKGAEGIHSALETAKHTIEGFIAAFAIEKIAEFGKHLFEGIDALKKFGDETGVGIQRIAEFKFAADKANVGDTFALGFRHFSGVLRQAQVDGSAMQAIFRELQVDPFQTLDAAFLKTADSFHGIEDGVNKMGMAEEVFGTRNAKFITLLSGGSVEIEKQAKLFRQLSGSDMKDAGKVAEDFNDAMTDLRTLAQGVFLDLSKDMMPMFIKWAKAIRDNHDLIRDLGQLLAAVLSPALKLTSASMQLLVIDGEILSKKAMTWATALALPLVVLEKLAVAFAKSSFASPGMNNVAESLTKDWDNIKSVLGKTQKDLEAAIKRGLEGDATAIGEGTEKMEAEAKKRAIANNKIIEALNDQKKKMMEEFGSTSMGIKKDIAGIQGNDAAAKFYGYQQEVEVAQKQINDLKKLNQIKSTMTKEELEKQNQLMKLYGDKQRALAVAQNVLILNTMQKMNDDVLTIVEAFGGKQSGLYKTMFAASKAFAIAESTIKIMQGIANAASQPWPLNLAAMASVIAATANIVSSIQAVKLEFGGAKEMGGPVSPNKMFLVGERGPEMFVPQGAGNIIPNNKLMGGGANVRVIVNNHTDAMSQIVERNEGDDRVIEVVLRRVKQEIGSDIKEGKGVVTKALQTTFGLRRGQTQ